MSLLTDSFPLSHITNHLLSTYPVFKAIFPPDGRNVVCIKVKSQSHIPTHSLNEMPPLCAPHACITISNTILHQNKWFYVCLILTAKLLIFNIKHLIVKLLPFILYIHFWPAVLCCLGFALCKGESTWITISLVFVACSIHSNWEVVVWDGALPWGGGMQDAPWQLGLDVLRREQDQNHQGKITSFDRRKKDFIAEQWERNVKCCDTHRYTK